MSMLSSNSRRFAGAHAPAEPATEARVSNARRTLLHIADRLERRRDLFERAHDCRCVFSHAFASSTLRLANALPMLGLRDPDWVAELTLRMAEHYLRALEANTLRTLAHGAWASVFEADERSETTVREALVLGMTTHIVHDLPLALCEVGMYTQTGKSRLPDYHALSELAAPAVEDVAREIGQRYASWFGPIGTADRLDTFDEAILTNAGMRVARATAWYNAQRLLEPETEAHARAAIRRWPQVLLDELLRPPSWSLRRLARGARLVSALTRRWPQHD